MTPDETAAAMTRLGAQIFADHMLGDPILTPKLGFAVARRRGLHCFSSAKLPGELFNHVSGYGTYAEASQRAIDAALRYYANKGGVVRIETLLPTVTRSERALLERNGFRDARLAFECQVRTTARAPRRVDVPGLTIERASAADAVRYARLATRGFGGGRTQIALVFERGWIRQIRRDRRVSAFIGSLNGADAATGIVVARPAIAGFYSGSVAPHFRGRGIQNAMIAARLTFGWERGQRVFYSWTDPDTASARNLRDEGFRTRYEIHVYERQA